MDKTGKDTQNRKVEVATGEVVYTKIKSTSLRESYRQLMVMLTFFSNTRCPDMTNGFDDKNLMTPNR